MTPTPLVLALTATLLALGPAMAFPDATPWDQDCRQCHTERPLQVGHLHISGLPQRSRPGGAYQLTVQLTHAGMRRAGVRLLVLGCNGTAGALTTTDRGLETEGVKARTTYNGTTLAKGVASKTWQLEWRAPTTLSRPCTLTFSLKANAANDDLSPLGDTIYELERAVAVTARP